MKPAPFYLESSLKMVEEISGVKVIYGAPKSEEEWIESLKGVEVAFAGGFPFTRRVFESSKGLKMIQTVSVGFDQIDIFAALDKSVIVCNVPEVMAETVAQHAWAIILALSKEIVQGDRLLRGGGWPRLMGINLWGKTLGIVGLGRIGRRVALKGKHAFDMRILAYDPYVDAETAQMFSAELVDLPTLMAESDVVSIHCPLTKDTQGLIGEKELSRMKDTALLVNTARGKVIDEKALIQLLQVNKIRGAGLDVFEEEPAKPNNPLLRFENVVLTPHIASSTTATFNETGRSACENVARYLKGRSPKWQINLNTAPWIRSVARA